MSEMNGANGVIQPRDLVRIDLAAGVRIHVAPVPMLLRRVFLEQARAEHPEPDPKEYEQTLPGDDNTLGGKLPADENPAYKEARIKAFNAQHSFVTMRVCIEAIQMTPDEQQTIIDHYAAEMARIRQITHIHDQDDWSFLWQYVIALTNDEINQITKVANGGGERELEPEEITAAAHFFRLKVRRTPDTA